MDGHTTYYGWIIPWPNYQVMVAVGAGWTENVINGMFESQKEC
jgi:hypothetical protein